MMYQKIINFIAAILVIVVPTLIGVVIRDWKQLLAQIEVFENKVNANEKIKKFRSVVTAFLYIYATWNAISINAVIVKKVLAAIWVATSIKNTMKAENGREATKAALNKLLKKCNDNTFKMLFFPVFIFALFCATHYYSIVEPSMFNSICDVIPF